MGVNLDWLIGYLGESHKVDGLKEFVESSGAEIEFRSIVDAIGMSLDGVIYLNKRRFSELTDNKVYFILLHEIAHHKRMIKFKYNLDEMFANMSEQQYINFIINEEIFADRYARQMYYKFNKELFPIKETQRLHLSEVRTYYANRIRFYYAFLKDNPEMTVTDITKKLLND